MEEVKDKVELPDSLKEVKVKAELPDHLNEGKVSTSHSFQQKRRRHKNILLLSSFGRSESSYLNKVLAKSSCTIYFFEPSRKFFLNYWNTTEKIIQKQMETYFRCDIPDYLYLRNSSLIKVRNKGARRTRDLCEQKEAVLVKTIRVRLSLMKTMMKDRSLNLKLIHLVRDPRGIMNSLAHVKWGKYFTIETICPNIMKVRITEQYFSHLSSSFVISFICLTVGLISQSSWVNIKLKLSDIKTVFS